MTGLELAIPAAAIIFFMSVLRSSHRRRASASGKPRKRLSSPAEPQRIERRRSERRLEEDRRDLIRFECGSDRRIRGRRRGDLWIGRR
ncbi:MAG: hypothetical protein AAGE01_12200 [Pseudomonadota bacterium]